MVDTLSSPVKLSRDVSLQRLRDLTTQAHDLVNSKLGSIIPGNAELKQFATQELSYLRVMVGDDYLTSGMKEHVVQPVLDVIAGWKRLRTSFNGAFQSFSKDVDALDLLDRQIEDAKGQREDVKHQIDRRAEADGNYVAAKKAYEEAEVRYNGLRDAEGRRPVNMKSYSGWYWLAMSLVFIAEILINYQIFLFFLGIPAIAAATTGLMGVLMAGVAHKHGIVLKQSHVLFAQHVNRHERLSEYRVLAFATFGFLLVIATAAASRYEYAVHIILAQGSSPLMGPEGEIAINPLKDVFLSVMGNVAAWAVGVFLSYFCHDKDPHYAEAKHEVDKTLKRYLTVRGPFNEEVATEEARLQRSIESMQKSAEARAADVQEPRDLRAQMNTMEDSVYDACLSAVRKGLDLYRNAILQVSTANPTGIQLVHEDKAMTAYEYQSKKVAFDRDLLARLSQ